MCSVQRTDLAISAKGAKQMTVTVFVYWETDTVSCIKVFRTAEAALGFAIPFVADKIGYVVTGDDNVDWDVLNTEIDHPDCDWSMWYDVEIQE